MAVSPGERVRRPSGRPTRDGARTAEAIREVASELFYVHGYEATSLREVARGVGIQVGSLYNHISGKDQLLSDILISILQDLIDALERSYQDVADPIERLRAGIDCHIRFHAEHRKQVFIGNSELRSLGEADLREVVKLRKRYEDDFRDLVSAAVAEADADLIDLRLQVFAILAVGTHVSTWYKPGRGRDLDSVVDVYTRMIFRQIGITAD
jgi:AcrR family transcriptional regulator